MKTVSDHNVEKNIEQAVKDVQGVSLDDVNAGKALHGDLIMAVITKPNGDKMILYEGRDVDLQGRAVGVWMRD